MSAIAQGRSPVGCRVARVVSASARKVQIMVDRRVSTRVRRVLEAHMIDPAGLRATAHVIDLSLGGCFVSTSETPPRGSRCQFFLSLPHEGLTAVDGEVVRVYPHVGCGVRFVEPSPRAGEALVRTLSGFFAEMMTHPHETVRSERLAGGG
jgi:PilZ domain